MADYSDKTWRSSDGMNLHYRNYAGREDRPPVVCMHGLTRNARDFANLADRLAGDWRVIVPELRGRGDSDYARDPATYNAGQYIEDLLVLLDGLCISRFVAIGTSLGGLMTMLIAMTAPERLAGAVLNDIGPVIEPEGLARIGGYVGQARSFPTWMHAARALGEGHGAAFPDYTITDWLAMAKRVMTLTGQGRIVFDYDMKIADAFAASPAPAPDLWPAIDAMKAIPMLVVRGALSDLFSAETLAAMARRMPQAETLTLARTGHAPTLDEAEAVAAISRLLARIG